MSANHSITQLLSGVKKENEEAVHALFLRCYSRVAGIGRRKLAGRPQRTFDEDDAAQSAFIEFLKDAKDGQFEKKLDNREDFWQIVTVLVADKIAKRLRHERAQKRGGGVPVVTVDQVPQAICDLDDPTLETEIADAKEWFFSKLPSEEHRQVAELVGAGLTQEQVAEKLNLSVRTVARRLDHISAALPRILDVPDPRAKDE